MKEPIPTLAMHYRANPWLKQYWETIQSDSGYDQNAVYQHANNGYTANAYQHAPTSNSSLVSHGMFNGRPAFMSSMPQAKPAVTDSDLGPYSPLSSSTTPQNEDSLNNGIATSKHLTGWKRKSDSEQFGMYHPSNPIDEEYVAALTTEPSDVRQQPQRPYHIVETQQETTDLPQEEEDLPQTGTPSTTVSSVQLPQFDSPSSVTVASTTDTPVTSLEMSDDGSISSPETPETENSLDNSPGPETQTSTNKKRSVGFSDEDYYGAKRAKLCQSGTDTGQASASPLPTANGHEAVLTTVSSTSEFVPTDHDYLIRDLVEYLLHHFTRTVSSTRFDKKVAGLYCAKFPVLEAKTSAQQILSRSKCKTLEELENKAVAAAHSGKIMAHLRVANKDINGSKFCEQPASTDLDIGARALPHTGVEVEAIPSQEKTMGFLKFPTDASIEDYDIPLLGSEHISNTPRSARPGALVPPTAGPESGAYEELPEMEFTEDFWKEDTFGSGFPE
ncbi:hypothetical protein EJ08DRAFT_168566 [Tothia fuscella]|uniref:Uncharacterized protein n=1 Tax=Tothia fuscella TaxID=1048955 RepID=A0A9P4TYY7_9PEZI|nr:hypothetical protein EJ08DRAFT_168566 [Tothia fuscella]